MMSGPPVKDHNMLPEREREKDSLRPFKQHWPIWLVTAFSNLFHCENHHLGKKAA